MELITREQFKKIIGALNLESSAVETSSMAAMQYLDSNGTLVCQSVYGKVSGAKALSHYYAVSEAAKQIAVS